MLREKQMTVCRTVAHTGLAVLTDCGEFDNIHPLDKQTVGYRLALQARKKVYGEDICADAPVFYRVVFEDGKAAAYFRHTDGSLYVKGKKLLGFEIAGRDGIFYPAEGTVLTEKVSLWSEKVMRPAYLRYAWNNYCEANLYGASGLPAAPFRTDQEMCVD